MWGPGAQPEGATAVMEGVGSMGSRVLVAYATKMGSNAEIAEAIASVLVEAGHEAVAAPARTVKDVDDFDAIVLGSALYAAHWQRDANRFVARRRDVLRGKRLWLWSSGPLDWTLAVKDLPPAANVLEIMGDVPFVGHRTFGGRLDPSLPGVDDQILKTHQQGDFRDWDAIRDYAAQIARALGAEAGTV
jgi:menaquinone-dependent protoporphyrinogen oxidase